MKRLIFTISLFLIFQPTFLSNNLKAENTNLITGFLPIYRTLPNDYDLSRLTHLIYFSLIPSGDGTFSWTSGRDSLSMYNTVQELKNRIGTSDTRLILSIGGTDAVGSGGYNTIAANIETTKLFVSRIKSILTNWGVDGVDIDWEKWLKTKEDSDNHEMFLKTLYDTLHSEGFQIFTDVSASNYNGQWVNDGVWNYVDYIQPMAYTFSGSWSSVSCHNSSFNQSIGAVNYWIGRGVPKEKILLGVPFYGIKFSGTDNVGEAYTNTSSINYSDILTAIESGNYSHSEIDDSNGPYIYKSDSNKEIIFYNDTTLMMMKGQYIIDSGYAGVMIWDLGQDEEGDRSLLNALSETVIGWSEDPVSNVFTFNKQINPFKIHLIENNLQIISTNFQYAKISIFNLQGQNIFQNKTINFVNNRVSISIPKISKGIYFTRISTANAQKFISQFVY